MVSDTIKSVQCYDLLCKHGNKGGASYDFIKTLCFSARASFDSRFWWDDLIFCTCASQCKQVKIIHAVIILCVMMLFLSIIPGRCWCELWKFITWVIFHHHHHVHEGLGVFPVSWSSKWSWYLHLFFSHPMFLCPFGLYCNACFGILFVSILPACGKCRVCDRFLQNDQSQKGTVHLLHVLISWCTMQLLWKLLSSLSYGLFVQQTAHSLQIRIYGFPQIKYLVLLWPQDVTFNPMQPSLTEPNPS